MILCSLTVYQCDRCKATFSVRNDAEWAEFSRTWHSDAWNDFCPICKHHAEAKQRIEYAKHFYKRIDTGAVEYVN